MRISPAPLPALWLVWLLVAFGALNVYGPPIDSWRRPGDPATISDNTLGERLSAQESLIMKLRNDRDIRRYFAYAEAALGRPYPADFIVPLEKAGLDQGEPNSRRLTTPARPLAPWRDFVVEYPPGMMLTALAPALLTSDADTYFRLFALEAEAALTLAVWLAVRTAERLSPGAGAQALVQAILLTLGLGVVAGRRYDPFVALALAAAIHALAARRPALSGFALGLAVALKGVPILLAPIFVIHAAQRRDWKGLAYGAAAGAAVLGPTAAVYVALAGRHALDALAYHSQRPLQIQTAYSGLLILARAFDPGLLSTSFGYGSLNVVSSAEPTLRALSTALLTAGVLGGWLYAGRSIAAARDDEERLLGLVRASLACLIAYITLGKVFSPQYCVWLIPLAAIAAPFSPFLARRLLPTAFLLIQAEYPFLYGALYVSTPGAAAGTLILVRTAFLWSYMAGILDALPARTPSPAPEIAVDPRRRAAGHNGGQG